MNRRKRVLALPPAVLLLVYLLVAVAPVAAAWALGYPPRPFLDELSSALALAAFALLHMEFLLSGRFEPVTGRVGIDVTMRLHQLMARVIIGLLIVHPFLYGLPIDATRPWDPTRRLTLLLEAPAVASGVVAWLGLVLVVAMAIGRDGLPFRYEAWRLSHGLGALLVALAGTHHALHAGRYSATEPLATAWLMLAALSTLTLVHVYLVKPLVMRRRPYRVSAVTPVAEQLWEVTVAPERGEALAFEAGQFVWLTLDRSPFSIREHPFSIASAPSERDRVRFLVKEVGDFTRRIGQVPIGARAYLDGPHGNLTLAGRTEPGIAFLAGGSGIAPIIAMLRELGHRGETRPMRLLHGNWRQEQIAHADELEALTRSLPLEVRLLLGDPPPDWTDATGRLDRETLEALLPSEAFGSWLFVICGPNPMIDAVEATLARIGVSWSRMLSEKFSYD